MTHISTKEALIVRGCGGCVYDKRRASASLVSYRARELLLYCLSVSGARVVCTEGIYPPVGSGIVDVAALDAVEVVVVEILEMHRKNKQELPFTPLPEV